MFRNLEIQKKGFTLVEVLLALAILTLGMGVLLASASRCLAVMKRAKQYQTAQLVFGLGEMEYPYEKPLMILGEDDDIEDLEVEDDGELLEGYTYTRTIEEEEDDDEDGLHVMRIKVTWISSGDNWSEEVVRYVYHPEDDDVSTP